MNMKLLLRRFGMIMVAAFLLLASAMDASAVLNAVGPIDPANGFPMWYRDLSGKNAAALTLGPCLDTNGLCLLDPALNLPNPALPVSFPDNFPEEFVYWAGDARIDLPRAANTGRRALLIMALEGAFSVGPVVPGDQVTFGRIRLRIDTPVAGTYVVTHPYGVETFVNVPVGKRAINFTRDIGIGAPGDFTGALASDIGPFLTWDPLTAAPAGYVGDPAVDHIVTGSPRGTNYFEIVGPPGSNLDGAGGNVVRTDLFTVAGKLATRFGVTATRATYTRDATGSTAIEVFASSAPGQTIDVTAPGLAAPVPMLEDPNLANNTNYYARFPLSITTAAVPDVTITNREINQVVDRADSVITESVSDIIKVTNALYQLTDPATGAGSLLVNAVSSDLLPAAAVVLTVNRPVLGPLATVPAAQFNTDVTIPGFVFPSARLILQSSQGGSYNEPLPIGDPLPVLVP